MVFLEFVGTYDDEVTYDYMPESKDAPRGTISVNQVTRDRMIHSVSNEDELPWYRGHAWQRIDEMLDAGNLEHETVSVWY